jgi:hypothetical protein
MQHGTANVDTMDTRDSTATKNIFAKAATLPPCFIVGKESRMTLRMERVVRDLRCEHNEVDAMDASIPTYGYLTARCLALDRLNEGLLLIHPAPLNTAPSPEPLTGSMQPMDFWPHPLNY